MPGLAASTAIFERIALPEDTFEIHFLEWEIPLDKETLADYAKRIAAKIKQPNPVLIGVSFGGILVQEMAKFMDVRKVIIISSVKSNLEFPRRLKIAKTTKAYKLIPMSLILNIESLAKFSFWFPCRNTAEEVGEQECERDKRCRKQLLGIVSGATIESANRWLLHSE